MFKPTNASAQSHRIWRSNHFVWDLNKKINFKMFFEAISVGFVEYQCSLLTFLRISRLILGILRGSQPMRHSISYLFHYWETFSLHSLLVFECFADFLKDTNFLRLWNEMKWNASKTWNEMSNYPGSDEMLWFLHMKESPLFHSSVTISSLLLYGNRRNVQSIRQFRNDSILECKQFSTVWLLIFLGKSSWLRMNSEILLLKLSKNCIDHLS